MKRHHKVLLVLAFAVPVFIELRTLFGDFFGIDVSLLASIVAAAIVSVVIVLVDERVASGGGDEAEDDSDGGGSRLAESGD